MKKLVETIVKPLVDYPEDVKVTQELYNGEIKYRLTVHPEDVGKVIGKQGKVAKAIRMLLYSVGHHNSEKVTLEINKRKRARSYSSPFLTFKEKLHVPYVKWGCLIYIETRGDILFMTKWFNVGKIVNTHGVKGEIRVVSRTDFPEERYKVGNTLYISNEKVESLSQ